MSGLGDGRRKTVKNTNDLERETEVPLHFIGNRKSLANVIIEDSFTVHCVRCLEGTESISENRSTQQFFQKLKVEIRARQGNRTGSERKNKCVTCCRIWCLRGGHVGTERGAQDK